MKQKEVKGLCFKNTALFLKIYFSCKLWFRLLLTLPSWKQSCRPVISIAVFRACTFQLLVICAPSAPTNAQHHFFHDTPDGTSSSSYDSTDLLDPTLDVRAEYPHLGVGDQIGGPALGAMNCEERKCCVGRRSMAHWVTSRAVLIERVHELWQWTAAHEEQLLGQHLQRPTVRDQLARTRLHLVTSSKLNSFGGAKCSNSQQSSHYSCAFENFYRMNE